MSEPKKETEIPKRPNPWAGRPVLITDKGWDEASQTKVARERKGTFHCWGFQRRKGEKQQAPLETVAVVELDDGRITCKFPEHITFLDRVGKPHPVQPEAHV